MKEPSDIVALIIGGIWCLFLFAVLAITLAPLAELLLVILFFGGIAAGIMKIAEHFDKKPVVEQPKEDLTFPEEWTKDSLPL